MCDSCAGDAKAVRLGLNGDIYVAGNDLATRPFPATPGAFMTTNPGSIGTWVARIDGSGTNMIWGTFFGATWSNYPEDLAVNGIGEPYLVGVSSGSNLPARIGIP